MSDRPILFSAPMVRALLAGTKTQTRRIVKPQPNDPGHLRIVNEGTVHYTRPAGDPLIAEAKATPGYRVMTCAEWLASQPCPYGQPGDRLWVRETWCHEYEGGYLYRADDPTGADPDFVDGDGNPTGRSGWKPSIHMPRKASRITLEITGVRVERLQEIGHRDAAAEGWPADDEARALAKHAPGCADDAAIEWYADLWDSINGPGSWDANPWVWVVEFKRVMP